MAVNKETQYEQVLAQDMRAGDILGGGPHDGPGEGAFVVAIRPWYIPVAPNDWSEVSKGLSFRLVERYGEITSSPFTKKLDDCVYRLRAKFVPEYMAHQEKSLLKDFSRLTTKMYPGACTGTDPEIFIVDEERIIIPAFRFLPDKVGGGPTIFNDGFQAEFTTRASGCHENLVESIYSNLTSLLHEAREHDPKAQFSLKSVMEIPAMTLEGCTEAQLELGCDPSRNAYDMIGRLEEAVNMPLRVAGGHLHFGMHEGQKRYAKQVIEFLDATLGICTVSMAAQLDNPVRRRYYGLAGEYRVPKHGLEYRTLSNFWLCAPPITHLTLDLARSFVALCLRGTGLFWKADKAEVVETINNCDVARAREILKRNEHIVKGVVKRLYDDVRALKPIFHGVESVVKDPLAVETNWGLTGSYNWDSPTNATWRSSPRNRAGFVR